MASKQSESQPAKWGSIVIYFPVSSLATAPLSLGPAKAIHRPLPTLLVGGRPAVSDPGLHLGRSSVEGGSETSREYTMALPVSAANSILAGAPVH
jgi:hypothetical protein